MSEPDEPPVGLVGRLLSGRETGFYVEIDDDTTRPGGSGGYYIFTWTPSASYDIWLETWDDVVSSFADWQVEWLSVDESSRIAGRHRHGPS
jgi:hypothetical protein